MDSSDEQVLLQSRCFLSNHQEQIKRKRKRTWVWEIFRKRWNKKFTINIVGDARQWQRIESQVICIMNFLAKVMKKNVRPFKVWSGLLLFIKILLKTAQLLYKHFPSSLFLFVSFISFFIKARILLEFFNQAFSILYMFSPFSFVFINALITST